MGRDAHGSFGWGVFWGQGLGAGIVRPSIPPRLKRRKETVRLQLVRGVLGRPKKWDKLVTPGKGQKGRVRVASFFRPKKRKKNKPSFCPKSF